MNRNAKNKTFTPVARRAVKQGELEIMKGRGSRQKWFYVDTVADAMTLVRLGRNYSFPTGVTENCSDESISEGFYIKA